MGDLTRRLDALEAIVPPCRTCAERPVFVMDGMPPTPSPCSECGRPIEPFVFTIDIDAASGREDAP